MTNVLMGFIDVGQGDCTLVVDAENREAVIIDCPAGRSTDVTEALRSVGGTRLSLALITHSDLDHLGGIYEVIRAVGVNEIRINLDSIVTAGDVQEKIKLKAAQRSIAGLADIGVEIRPCYRGDEGTCGAIMWRALSPTHDLLLLAQGRGERNIASVILRLEVGAVTALIGGDAPAGAFDRARLRGEILSADIFRLSHHGGRIDQLGGPEIGELLDHVNAQHHVVSVGSDNTYGHPLAETLLALARINGRARVTCTEVTDRCRGSGVLPLPEADSLPALARLGAGGRSNACRCAGSVWVRMDNDGWVVEPSESEHGRVIDALARPMCRVGTSSMSVTV